MKKLIMILLVIVCCNTMHAQTYAEWFRQKKTQIDYLVKQVMALKEYAIILNKGYAITQHGLEGIRLFTGEEAALHQKYFSSLRSLSPAVARYPGLKNIFLLKEQTDKEIQSQQNYNSRCAWFNEEEKSYLQKVLQKLSREGEEMMEELQMVTGPEVQMTDDERIKRIDGMYTRLQKQWRFLRDFGNDNKVLALQRERAHHELQIFK